MEKKYNSTRNRGLQIQPKQAIIQGLAADGGLFVFDDIDKIKLPLADMMDMDYKQMAQVVLSALLFDFSEDEVKQCVENAYEGKFDTQEITPVVFSGADVICELFHGPTSAFKDVGLRMLPQLMSVSLKQKKNQKVMILTATSGDTGKAALAGFQDVENVGITVFYPDHGVSEIQRLQMITQEGNNTGVVAIKGNFDDAQSGVKRIFNDVAFRRKFKQYNTLFSSANSINIGRLIPQVVYYFYAYKRLVEEKRIRFGEQVDFCVPTGNFGNVLAGYYAKMMGLPVHRFIVAANANNVLYDFLTTGIYNRNRPFHKTISPSMDILISSNLERLLYYASDKDANYVSNLMEELNSYGKYQVKTSILSRIQSLFSTGFASDEECAAAIKEKYEKDGYVLDPHTACAYAVMKQVQDSEHVCVLMSTASPYKFCTGVYEALFDEADSDEFTVMEQLEQKTGTKAPQNLKGLKEKPIRHRDVIGIGEMKACVAQKTKELLR
ncbi:threonine synthase [bacterium c-19]|nr:threonine synthase [bacterium c-19]